MPYESSDYYVLFFGKDTPFSHHRPCQFTVDGNTYHCMEQYMMYKKAELFEDEDIMRQVMRCNNPGEIKRLGRQVKDFDIIKWMTVAVDIVKQGNRAKFSQNQSLKNELYNTHPRQLVEASPSDQRWGIGLSGEWDDAWDEKKWLGRNLLGKLLTNLRDEMMMEEKVIHKRTLPLLNSDQSEIEARLLEEEKERNAKFGEKRRDEPNKWPRNKSSTFEFFGWDSPFSNYHERQFDVKGEKFFCLEQYLLYKKAELFGDTKAKSIIMKVRDSSELRERKISVANFRGDIWNKARIDFYMTGAQEKFEQNPDLQEMLLATFPKIIMMANKNKMKRLISNPSHFQFEDFKKYHWSELALIKIRDKILGKDSLKEFVKHPNEDRRSPQKKRLSENSTESNSKREKTKHQTLDEDYSEGFDNLFLDGPTKAESCDPKNNKFWTSEQASHGSPDKSLPDSSRTFENKTYKNGGGFGSPQMTQGGNNTQMREATDDNEEMETQSISSETSKRGGDTIPHPTIPGLHISSKRKDSSSRSSSSDKKSKKKSKRRKEDVVKIDIDKSEDRGKSPMDEKPEDRGKPSKNDKSEDREKSSKVDKSEDTGKSSKDDKSENRRKSPKDYKRADRGQSSKDDSKGNGTKLKSGNATKSPENGPTASKPDGSKKTGSTCDKSSLAQSDTVLGNDMKEKPKPSKNYRKMKLDNLPQEKKYIFVKNDSNLHFDAPCKFTVEEVEFTSVEQYASYRKAELFNDDYRKHKILEFTELPAVKRASSEIRGFDPGVWFSQAAQIYSDGCQAKFDQNPEMKQELFDTYPSIIEPRSKSIHEKLTEADYRKLETIDRKKKLEINNVLTHVRNEMMKQDGLID